MQGSGKSSLYLRDDLSGLIQQDIIDQLGTLSTAYTQSVSWRPVLCYYINKQEQFIQDTDLAAYERGRYNIQAANFSISNFNNIIEYQAIFAHFLKYTAW